MCDGHENAHYSEASLDRAVDLERVDGARPMSACDTKPDRLRSAFGGRADIAIQAAMSAFDPKRTLMLQNHLWECSLSVCSLATIRCPILTVRDDDEAARVHHASQLRGGDLAAHSPRAAARAYAARRHPPGPSDPTCRSTPAGPKLDPDAFGSDLRHGVSVERRGGIALAGR